jgi:nucleoside 2-deoxyribosyltransferase
MRNTSRKGSAKAYRNMRATKCYVAGPLFSEQDRRLLEEIGEGLEARGIAAYLPHRDGGDLGTVVFKKDRKTLRGNLFREDLKHIEAADFLVSLLDGQDSDSGTCVEIGMAYAAGIPVFGLKTDLERRGGVVNNMVWGVCDSGSALFADVQSLLAAVDLYLSRSPRKARKGG